MKAGTNRREFLKCMGFGTIGLGFGVYVFDNVYQYAEASTEGEKHQLLTKGTVNFKGFVAKEITPNDEFYITTYSSTIPDVNVQTFRLRIEGLVEKPFILTLKELEEMKDKTEFVTLECIGNPVGGDSISNALWDGVTIKKIIERAVPKKGIVKTVFYADDGYSDSIPYSLSLSEDVFLAFRMNGEPLPKVHGYPVRAIVPAIYGMKHVKWLSKIELVNYNYKGYWEKKGWSDEATIPIKSQILMPMDKKRISLDDGRTLNETEIKPPLSKWAWTLWRFDWKPVKERSYTIKIRGIDRAGKIQESASLIGDIFSTTYPDGAKGQHAVDVLVVKN